MKLTKVIQLEIVKPENGDWKSAGELLRKVQKVTSKALNHCLREYYLEAAPKCEALLKKGEKPTKKILLDKTSRTKELGELYGAEVGSYVYGTIDNISRQRWNTDWFDILIKGTKSLPSYRADCPIFIRATGVKIWELQDEDYLNRLIEFKLLPAASSGRQGPKETFIIHNKAFDNSRTAIWNRLLTGEYKLGTVQILYKQRRRKWFVNLSYTFEVKPDEGLNPNVRVGADLGLAVPVCLALNSGYARAYLHEEGKTIGAFRRQIERRRRALRRNERDILERRKGHGRAYKLKSIDKLQELAGNFRRTAYHRLSRAVINFALKNKAGVIVLENLKGFSDEHAEDRFLKGWTYHELQTMVEQKASEVGISVEYINPKYTSQRCSRCGHIEKENRESRKFKCISCGQSFDADYNAARNIATVGIEKLIDKFKNEDEKHKNQA